MENNLQVIEKNGQRVLTTIQLAESYGTDAQKIQQNYANNKNHYEEGKHFILLVGEELKDFKRNIENFEVAQNINKLYLWTKKGALLHAKSLNTIQAWDAYSMLIDDYYEKIEQANNLLEMYLKMSEDDRAIAYFTERKEKNQIKEQLLIAEEKADKYQQFLDDDGLMTINTLAKVIGIGRNKLFELLRKNKVLMYSNQPYQRYMNQGLFKVINKQTKKNTVQVTLLTHKGADYIDTLVRREKSEQTKLN